MFAARRGLLVFFAFTLLAITIVSGAIGGVVGFMAARSIAPASVAVSAEPILARAPESLTQGTASQPAAPAASGGDGVVDAVAKVKPAVVRIATNSGSGSGVIIDKDGYILTNNHVVEGARTFQVRYDNGTTVTGRLVGTYPASDVAIIKVDDPVPAVAPLGDSTKLKVGERVIAIGSPLGQYTNSVTTGIVSATNRSLGGINGLIQTDAPINSGNSGGPLVNLAGEVVGINTAVVRGGGGNVAEGLGFAVSSSVARVVAKDIIAGQAVQWPYMGIGMDGVRVTNVDEASGAGKAGLQAGDIITAIEGQPVTADTPLSAVLLNFSVGQTVKVEVQRNGQPLTLEVTLGARPATSG